MFSKRDIERYFLGEKQGGKWFFSFGFIAILAAIVILVKPGGSYYTGGSIPMFVIGTILTVVGFVVHRKSDSDRIRATYAFDMEPSWFRDKEFPRMQKMMRGFRIFLLTELLMVLGGIGIFIFTGKDPKLEFWKGFGITLSGMGLIGMVLDLFAMNRGAIYTKGIASFINKT